MKRSLLATIRAALGTRSEGTRRPAPRKGRLPLTVEEMESRIVMTTATGWYALNTLGDSSLRSTAILDIIHDGQITRNDMIQLFKQASNQFTNLPNTDAHDLITLVNNGSAIGMPDYVLNLASKVLSYSSTTTYYNWGLLSGTAPSYNTYIAGNIGSQVNNFFLGQSRPSPTVVTFNGFWTVTTGTYQVNNLPLFAAGGPKYQDVKQGLVGDCWLLVSLAEVADRNPGVIQNMFVNNGDGTYTVRFYNNGTPDYVTVDQFLPNGGNLYAQPQGCLWVALAEKAYAQECAYGWIGTFTPNASSYQGLNSGYAEWGLRAITGNSAGSTPIIYSPPSLYAGGYSNTWAIDAAWQLGQYVVLCTTGGGPNVVPDHCYALVSDAYGAYQLFNPWGVAGNSFGGTSYPGFVFGNATFVATYFSSFTSCVSAMPSTNTTSMSAVLFAAAHPAGPTGEPSAWHEPHSLTTATLPTSSGDAEAAMLASISQGRQPHFMQRLAALDCVFADGPADGDVLSGKSLKALVTV